MTCMVTEIYPYAMTSTCTLLLVIHVRYDSSTCDIKFLRLKDKDYCPIEIIKGLTDKGQFKYLTKLMGPQEGTYLYATQFHSLR